MNIDEQIAVLQAYKEGRTIYCKNKNDAGAFGVNIEEDGTHFLFDFDNFENTIISEPREFWIVKSAGIVKRICMSEEEALRFTGQHKTLKPGVEIIHVREVTGE